MILYRQSLEKSLTLQKIASLYLDCGLNVIPLILGGTKSPFLSTWKQYQYERVTERLARKWWCCPFAIAILTGKISGNLEVLDFDDFEVFKFWRGQILLTDRTLLDRMVIVETPDNGRHLYYRCSEIENSQHLAQAENQDVLIETRGEGGYVVAPGSPIAVHKSKRPYKLLQGSFADIPVITPAERQMMFEEARALNLYEAPIVETHSYRDLRAELKELYGELHYLPKRPGDDFNERATWKEVLEPHGWQLIGSHGSRCLWRRPGKSEGSSATTNYQDTGLLIVFSTSTAFQPGKGYTKFAAFAILNHGGDFAKAAQELSVKGFGS